MHNSSVPGKSDICLGSNDLQVAFQPSYEISRSMGITPRCLSLLTGNYNVSAAGKRVNVGLCIKDAQKGLCVPDFARPHANNQGWLYSQGLTQILQRYKVLFPL